MILVKQLEQRSLYFTKKHVCQESSQSNVSNEFYNVKLVAEPLSCLVMDLVQKYSPFTALFGAAAAMAE